MGANVWQVRYHCLYVIRGVGGMYIGCTSSPIEKRFAEHVAAAYGGSHLALHKAIREHSEGAFTIERLSELRCSRVAALAAEQAAIAVARMAGAHLFNRPTREAGVRSPRPRRAVASQESAA